MISPLFERLGDWNPQLMRELKGRLKLRNSLLVVTLAIVAQVVLLLLFAGQIPEPANSYNYERYLLSPAPNYQIDWIQWWTDIFRVMTWGLPYLVMAIGSYMLITDISQEDRRGTLDFIRLSPQSAREIFTGKLLGVPVLAYLGVSLLIPLHGIAAIGGHVPLGFLVSYYMVMTLGTVLCLSAAMLLSVLQKEQKQAAGVQFQAGLALGYVLLVVFFAIPGFMAWNAFTTWQPFSGYVMDNQPSANKLTWFALPVGDHLVAAHAFVIGNLVISIVWVWRLLHRCYHMPTSTPMSKRQGFGFNLYSEGLLLGFLVPRTHSLLTDWADYDSSLKGMIVFLAIWHLFKFMVLIAALTPQRQVLLDWARYGHQDTSRSRSRQGQWWTVLLWGEKSPATLAIALNLGILMAIWLPLLILPAMALHLSNMPWGLLLNAGLILAYTLIVHLVIMSKVKKPVAIALTIILGLAFVPALAVLAPTNGYATGLGAIVLLFTPCLWSVVNNVSILTIGFGALGQLAAIVLLHSHLSQRMKTLGQSTSAPALATTQ